jgi:hypothetical protein
MRNRLLIIVLLVPALATPAPAGILFGRKKEKIDPKTRVPEVVAALRGDKDADKRARAAEELRNYDPAAFPDVVPALIMALQSDPKPAVRAEAAQTLGKLRPVSQQIGEALEQALATDSSMRVRLQARSSLLSYHWAGYRSAKKTDVPPLPPPTGATGKEPPVIQTAPPPAAKPALKPVPVAPTTRPGPQALTPPVPSTKEPPLAPPAPPAGGDTSGGPELP